MPDLFFYIIFFILGTIIGSFLNVVVLRYNTGVSIARGRSFCFSCGKKLSWSELVPVLSFLFQKGKCCGCKSKISWQYPVVEVLTGLLFLAIFLKYGLEPISLLIGFILVSVLIAITVYDIRQKIIPDGLVVIFSIVSLINTIFIADVNLFWFLIAGPLLALPLFLIWLFSGGRAMGLGDPKLVLGIGWFLGPIYGLSALVLAFWIGAIYGLLMMLLSKLNFSKIKLNYKSEVPFAPFLILGFLLVFFFGFDVFNLLPLLG
jgi:prepilin signal peptidase PulO-like enzyme (type II secretory pathway)